MKKPNIAMLALILAVMVILVAPMQAKLIAGEAVAVDKIPHVNVAVFHKLRDQKNFQYPKNIASDDIVHALAGKAQFISINHAAGLKDGDVIMLSNDVLREASNGALEDFGVGCQLAVSLKGTDVTLAGMCQVFFIDGDHQQVKHKGIVKPVLMKPDSDWQLIYDDMEDGIAVYADEEIGLE